MSGALLSFKASILSGMVLALGGISEAIAQEVVPALVSHARVRVTAPNLQTHPVVGKLVSVRGDTILLIVDGATAPTALPKPEVRRLDISRGMRRQTRAGAVTGMVFGGLAGLIIGNAEAERCKQSGDSMGLCDTEIAKGALLGMTAGALVGGLVGSRFRIERWQPVPLGSAHLQAMVAPDRTGLTLAVAF